MLGMFFVCILYNTIQHKKSLLSTVVEHCHQQPIDQLGVRVKKETFTLWVKKVSGFHFVLMLPGICVRVLNCGKCSFSTEWGNNGGTEEGGGRWREHWGSDVTLNRAAAVESRARDSAWTTFNECGPCRASVSGRTFSLVLDASSLPLHGTQQRLVVFIRPVASPLRGFFFVSSPPAATSTEPGKRPVIPYHTRSSVGR